MYNRYIPQSDGSYRRSRIPDEHQRHQPAEKKQEPDHHDIRPPETHGTIDSFLKKLLPKEFDTGDLLIVLLLLLMAEQSEEDKGTALLTLALYFLM